MDGGLMMMMMMKGNRAPGPQIRERQAEEERGEKARAGGVGGEWGGVRSLGVQFQLLARTLAISAVPASSPCSTRSVTPHDVAFADSSSFCHMTSFWKKTTSLSQHNMENQYECY
ncbi:unnamed protein product [Pleuronectes platessa]|uniref:Uncharacterized protein n=1 Tax=Pleuronectes platessa TaxID=8262 RepID=A0A9N7VAI2_PLEPL|nr:unnamed protein product [Pleuronectes platessa]